MIMFCKKYNILLGHSIAYYLGENGLDESPNKILMRVINKMLAKNQKYWHFHFKFALYSNRISTKRSTCMSHFQLIYGIDVVFLINLTFPVMKLMQDFEEEPNEFTRRMKRLIEVQQKKKRRLIKNLRNTKIR